MRMIQAFLVAVTMLLTGCGLASWATSPEAQMANAIANGAACGYAAANGTPCTPKEVLEALAKDAAAQRAKVEAVLPQAAQADPALAKTYADLLAANAENNRRLTEAVLLLATRAAAPPPAATTATPTLPSAPAVLPSAPAVLPTVPSATSASSAESSPAPAP